MRWPGRLPEDAVIREPLENLDLFVLFLVAADVPLPQHRIIDGRNPLPVMRSDASSRHRKLYFRYYGVSGMRQGRWKPVRPDPDGPLELYDLSVDFAASRDLADRRPERVQRLWQ